MPEPRVASTEWRPSAWRQTPFSPVSALYTIGVAFTLGYRPTVKRRRRDGNGVDDIGASTEASQTLDFFVHFEIERFNTENRWTRTKRQRRQTGGGIRSRVPAVRALGVDRFGRSQAERRNAADRRGGQCADRRPIRPVP